MGSLPPPASQTATPPEPPKVSSASSAWTGYYIGGELAKNSWRNRSTETLAATGTITNQFTDSGDPLGGGITGGFNFKNGNLVFGPFASIDLLHQTMNHNFGGGNFLGTTTHRIVTAGAKLGIETMPGLLVYGIGGVSWLNEDMNINFGGPVTSQNTTVRGFTLGPGIEFQPAALQKAGMPVSVFAQYQHTWWQDANLNNPVASPGFNYAFHHTDDTIRFGVNIYFP